MAIVFQVREMSTIRSGRRPTKINKKKKRRRMGRIVATVLIIPH
jgi:hypothetical protein